MHYYLYKLSFDTPVHFGADVAGIGVEKAVPTCHADTLFSAICNEVLLLNGEEDLHKWVNKAQEGNFLVSDLFPYDKENLYLPKPCYIRKEKKEDLYQDFEESKNRSKDKKDMKNLKFIPIDYWDFYIEYLLTDEKQYKPTNLEHICMETVIPKVSMSRDEKDNQLFSVGAYVFAEDSGLYFIAAFSEKSEEAKFRKIIQSLGYSGIGGERSSGYGKFKIGKSIELSNNSPDGQEKILYSILTREKSNFYVTLSVVSPESEELKTLDKQDCYYLLVPRKGFVYSSNYSSHPVKRKPVVMFNTGSCFKSKLKGNILDLKSSEDEAHPVYRYGKAMMVGI